MYGNLGRWEESRGKGGDGHGKAEGGKMQGAVAIRCMASARLAYVPSASTSIFCICICTDWHSVPQRPVAALSQ